MPARIVKPLAVVALAVMAVMAVMGLASVAWAHSLDSSTISLRVHDDSVDATISVALETLDEALGTDYVDDDIDTFADEVVAYLDEHLVVVGADGEQWAEVYSNPVRETVEGIESFSVDVAFDAGSAGVDDFTLAYDAIIEAVPGHEAVVVLTDADGDISTAGVIAGPGDVVEVSGGSHSTAVGDMVRYGFDHVLEGADHLLFLAMLLLTGPLVAEAGAWRPVDGPWTALRKVVHIVTAFTIGHSLTLIAAASGWVSAPSRPVEVLIAASVGVSAVHAMRPLARHGEEMIALGFGLVHGLAFAGILTDLGLEGSTSVISLLAFNIGVELSQLVTAVLVFPSIYLLSRTRAYTPLRMIMASFGLAAATGWALDRLEVLDNPFAGAESAAIGHPWFVVGGLAVVAVAAWFLARRHESGLPSDAAA